MVIMSGIRKASFLDVSAAAVQKGVGAVIKVDLNFIAMTLINYFCDKDKQTEGRIK